MVKYRSRLSNKPVKVNRKPKKKMTTTNDQASSKVLFPDPSSIPLIGANVAPKESPSGGQLSSGGVLSTGGNLKAPVGGALRSGGSLSPEDVEKLGHQDFIHALGNMSPNTFHILQGGAGAFLGMHHPMRVPVMSALGGAFDHSKNVSRLATKDVFNAQTPQHLSKALHKEWMDHVSGEDTGGGLFDSLKMLAKKLLSKGKKAANVVSRGVTTTAKRVASGVASGSKAAIDIGNKISDALKKGITVADQLSPVAELLGPRATALLSSGTEGARKVQQQVERGRDLAQQVSSISNPISQLLGDIDAPLFVEDQ